MWYTTGKINVTKNSNTVIGVGTKWANPLSGVSAGRMLILQSSNQIEIYEIASVQSDTRLTLAESYNGVTEKDKAYKIPTSPSVSIEQFALEIASSLAYHQQQLDGWQKILTGSGDVELIAPDGQKVIIKSQKKLSNLIDNAVKKSGDEIKGQLRFSPTSYGVKFLHENGNELVLRPSGDSFIYAFYDAESKKWTNKLRYAGNGNTWRFENVDDVTINNKSVLKAGDYGIGSSVGATANNFDDHLAGGFYQCRTTDFSDLQLAGNSTATLLAYPSSSTAWKVEQLSVVNSKEPRIYYRCDTKEGKQKWHEAITTANIKDFAYQFKGDLANTSLNNLTGTETGIYFQGRNAQATTENNYPVNQAGTLQVFKNGADGAGCCQIYTAYRNARQFIRNYRGGTRTWEPWVEQITTANINKYIPIGDQRLMPFRRDELPFGWYFRNGDNFLLDSPQGQALNGLSANYKRDHNITIKTINGKQYINVPTAFAPDGRGYFERAVNGINRQVGSAEDDAIRNIYGELIHVFQWKDTQPRGVFRTRSNNGGSGLNNRHSSVTCFFSDSDYPEQTIVFDASLGVPTAHETRVINQGKTPVIYLGV